jgi:hypothetical protein
MVQDSINHSPILGHVVRGTSADHPANSRVDHEFVEEIELISPPNTQVFPFEICTPCSISILHFGYACTSNRITKQMECKKIVWRGWNYGNRIFITHTPSVLFCYKAAFSRKTNILSRITFLLQYNSLYHFIFFIYLLQPYKCRLQYSVYFLFNLPQQFVKPLASRNVQLFARVTSLSVVL